jgi:hypothetical protein
MHELGRALSSDEVARARAWGRGWSPFFEALIGVACAVTILNEVRVGRAFTWPVVLVVALAAYVAVTVVVTGWTRARRLAALAPGEPTVILEGRYHEARGGKNYGRPRSLGVHRIQLATNRTSPADGAHARARAIALPSHPWFNDVPEWLVVDWEPSSSASPRHH